MTYRVSEHVRTSRDDDGAILFDVAHGAMFDLNDVAARIWDGVRRGHSESQIVDLLRAAFPAAPAEIVAADVRATIDELRSRRVLLE
jgi:hypothetical protein